MNPKPLIFVDLDDTLFQTHRKQAPTAQHKIATVDKTGQPLSYMHPKQQVLANWLFQSADVVPVTARSVNGLKRVDLSFQHGAICTHGGTVLDAGLQADQDWLALQQRDAAALGGLLQDLPQALQQAAQQIGAIRTQLVEENGRIVYAYAKQEAPEPLFLSQLVPHLPAEIMQHCYVHLNGNNLALIPHYVSKQKAVEFYLNKHDPQRERAVLGWGDSLSDAGFLTCCDWFGMPKNSQLDKFLAQSLMQDHHQKGFLGHV